MAWFGCGMSLLVNTDVILRTASISALAFSPDGTLLAVGGSAHSIQLWDMNTSQLRDSLIGHTYSVSTLAFSPDGALLASGSGDDTIRLWDAGT